MTTTWVKVSGHVVQGHGVASGQANDPRFPQGTLKLQMPVFETHGLCLDDYFPGTINISIQPACYEVKQAKYTFRQVKWAENAPPEDFSFFDCRVILPSSKRLPGLIYYPHPETKPEHFQDPATLEVLTKFIEGMRYGMSIGLELDPQQLRVG